MAIRFIYFDLGNVLLNFSHRRMCQQMAAVAGVEEEPVRHALFDSGLEIAYERGELSTTEFYDRFCEAIDRRADFDRLALACGDIFWPNTTAWAVLGQLMLAGYPLGLLSNTNELHWNFFGQGRYGILPGSFRELVLSFRVGAVKPELAIYEAAVAQAGVAPGEVFFVDDVEGHVAGALEAGIDAVQYTTTARLVADLRQRGVEFNY